MIKELEIQHTEDHSVFRDITSNREVDQRHVNRLKKAIQEVNLLHLNPIIVNSEMEIVDGQHRLEAARDLQVPIYYVVDNDVNKKHIAGLNSNQKNWSLLDYVNYYAVEKVPEFLVLAEFICRFSFCPVSTILQLMSHSGTRSNEDFKAGVIDISNRAEAERILLHIQEIRNLGVELAFDRQFILAIKDAFKVEEYTPPHFLKKLSDNKMDLIKCAKKQQYLQLIEQIYNKHQHTKLRFY